MVTMGSLKVIKSPPVPRNLIFSPTATPFPKLGAHKTRPLVKSCTADCGQTLEIQRWFALTFYGNISSPYPRVGLATIVDD